MKLIFKSIGCRYIVQDIETNKIYFQVNKLEGQSLLMSDFDKVECELSSHIIIREIYDNHFFSWLSTDAQVYYFKGGELNLVKDLGISNLTLNNNLKRFYYVKCNPIDYSYSLVCYDINSYCIIFEMPVEKFAMSLIYFEEKIILVNSNGTQLFFYENDNLLFTKDIPLYYKMVVDIYNPDRRNQTFKLITKYEQQLICAVNDERIISVDINTGEILWELTDKEVQGGSTYTHLFSSLFAYATAVDNIIHVLHSSIYMQIDIATRVAKIVKDFKVNELNIAGLGCGSSTLYKNKFYFLASQEADRQNTSNKFGVFNIDTLTLEQVVQVELPRRHFLNAKPIVDDKYVYIRDSEQCLYIYGKEAVDEKEIAIFQSIIESNKLQNKTEEKELPKPTVQELDIEEDAVLDVFGDVVSPTSYYIGLPDCITQSDDYKGDIKNAFKLTNGLLVLNDFQSEEQNNTFILNLIVNGVAEVFTMPYTGQYIEGEELVIQLNALIDKYDKNNAKRFLVLGGPEVDFGIAFITEAEKQALITGGHIWEV